MSADRLLRCSNKVWKQLIDSSLTRDERISLIAGVSSDRDVFSAHKALSASDAQSVVDVIDEVPVHSRVRMTGPLT